MKKVDDAKRKFKWNFDILSFLKEGFLFLLICCGVFVFGMSVIHYESLQTLVMNPPPVVGDQSFEVENRYFTGVSLSSISPSGRLTGTGNNTDIRKINKDVVANHIEELVQKNQKKSNRQGYQKPLESYVHAQRYNINFPLNTLPPETRIYIDSIDTTAPIVKMKNPPAKKLLSADFGEELNKGVVKYPGTANFGELGATLIFGHSSTAPREKNNDYGEIFAKLPHLSPGHTITIFHESKAYSYEVVEQKIVWPKSVPDLFETYNQLDEHTLILMACYPIFTDLQRILIIAKPKT